MRAIQVDAYGGAEQLKMVEAEMPTPKEGESLVRMGAIGVNFIDVYHRTGLYPVKPPFIPGIEGAGTVEAIGKGTRRYKKGDRVAFTGIPGAYAEYICVPDERMVPVPYGVTFEDAAAIMLQGCTAHYLSRTTYPLKRGDTCLVHAVAGGVGLLLTQMAKKTGARVIGTCSTKEKAALGRKAGADEVILYTEKDFEEETKRLTSGRGVEVVYDSVGKTTFLKSLNSLRPRGMMVSYGQASGKIDPIEVGILGAKGSLFLTRPTLVNYIETRDELERRTTDLFNWLIDGALDVRIGKTWPLGEAAAAHRALEGRETTGKCLLIP